jgi:hypothetical protein
MNWMALVLKLVGLVPVIVSGVEAAYPHLKGDDKKQMALDALGLSSQVATAVAPQYAPAIGAATSLAGNMIDGVVATFNAAGHPLFKPAAAAPAQ